MRESLRLHAPAVTTFGTMLAIALLMGTTIHAALPSGGQYILALPGPPIDLPAPEDDADGDSYGDEVDLSIGDRMIRILVDELHISGDQPYIIVGTQHDHWRLGQGAELAWPHVVDHDPLGHKVGSPEWIEASIVTGAWWQSIPAEGASKAIAGASDILPNDQGTGITWPQAFNVNIRDDIVAAEIVIRLFDAKPDPDKLAGEWQIQVDTTTGAWQLADQVFPAKQARLLEAGSSSLRVNVSAVTNIEELTQREIAKRWSPTIHFATGERFYPLPGDVMPQFHGIAKRAPDHRTWTREFNNARDAYLLFLADFNGDRTTDHRDAAVMVDLLRAGDLGNPTVYSHVTTTTGDQVVVQYWLLYAYNFVRDEGGNDIEFLAHNGDREFVQLRFANFQDALHGRPIDVTYSQHYKGVRFDDPGPGVAPFVDPHHFDIYVSQGSHASYPLPGTDAKLRPTFAGFGDTFDGGGEVWRPGNYSLELLSGQDWHQGYLWGPITRHHRDLGTATKPLLQHTFRYPFLDPILWQHNRPYETIEELADLYGSP